MSSPVSTLSCHLRGGDRAWRTIVHLRVGTDSSLEDNCTPQGWGQRAWRTWGYLLSLLGKCLKLNPRIPVSRWQVGWERLLGQDHSQVTCEFNKERASKMWCLPRGDVLLWHLLRTGVGAGGGDIIFICHSQG